LDTEKNQYETAQTASPADQHQKEVEDALAKLDALAKRQEDLANQQHNPQQSFQERWQQEMLRREAEQLQRQLEQMTRNGQQGSSGSTSAQQTSQQQSSSSPSASGRTGSPSSQTQAGSSASQSSDQRIEEALKRLHRATDAMKRSGGPQQSANAGQQAADDLHQAANVLAGTQQQLADGKVGSLSGEAERLRQEERAQADRINKFVNQQNSSSATDLTGAMARLHERDLLAHDRQQLSDDLSKLQKNLRDAAREMAPTQPGAAQKLRDALTEMDESDLDNHVQRTADWLRRGINPNSNGTETEIAQGLSKLNQQLQQAQKMVGQGNPVQSGSDHPDQSAALNQVERLRSQLEAMAASHNSSGRTGRNWQSGNTGRAADNREGQRVVDDTQRGSDVGAQSGDIRYGSGVTDGTVWDNINTGNNRYGQPGQPPAPADASANPADTERTYQQGLRELNQLRHLVKDDPQAAKEVAELARQMLLLDPKRFPGNPAMVEQMHREVLSSVDRLELQLERDGASSEARTGKSYTVPSGYQESVAEYYRRLSKNP
jgi:hypothetical protein